MSSGASSLPWSELPLRWPNGARLLDSGFFDERLGLLTAAASRSCRVVGACASAERELLLRFVDFGLRGLLRRPGVWWELGELGCSFSAFDDARTLLGVSEGGSEAVF